MAISTNSVFEVRTAGSDTNGGGFVTGASGTDYSQQNSANSTTPNKSTTDAVTAATTTVTSATAGFTAAIVGNIIYLAGGTGTLTGAWYQVTAFTNSTTITIDRAPGVSTGVTMNIGGALKSPGQASVIAIGGNIVFCLNIGADGASIFSITSASTGVANGCIASSASAFIQGYTTTRSLGNTDARPTFQLNVSTATIFAAGSDNWIVQGIVFDGNSQTAAKLCTAATRFVSCLFKNFNTQSAGGQYIDCVATTNSGIGIFGNSGGSIAVRCEAYANTATPFNCQICVDCIASGNTGGTTDGFIGNKILTGCISVSNGRNGFLLNATPTVVTNCHAESNTGAGFSVTTLDNALLNCSAYNNTGGATSFAGNNVSNIGFITVTVGSVFVNAAAFNFLLNNLANQGALLRAAADPATFPRGLTSNYRDIGAAQHKDSPSTTNIFVIDD